PCDFVLIAASNINDMPHILPPLRSRIVGNGYEVLLDTWMPDTPENRAQLTQFIAQEIRKDAKIPHADASAVEEILALAGKRAKDWDGQDNALTLKLRELSGIIRLAGDLAHLEGGRLINAGDVRIAIKRGRNIEEQLQEKYGSVWKAGASELAREKKTDQKEVG
ncbi:MAG: Lon protease family protein, partial [Candidatus Micrarchaeota archaeon]